MSEEMEWEQCLEEDDVADMPRGGSGILTERARVPLQHPLRDGA